MKIGVFMDREKKYLLMALLISLAIIVASYVIYQVEPVLDRDSYVSRYTSILRKGGIYEETITYVVLEKGHYMLYRSWHTSLGLKKSGEYIQPIDIACPSGFIPYVYTYDKKLTVLARVSEDTYNRLKKILEDSKAVNEIGCYNPNGIVPGEYTVKYKFILHPRLYCNETHCLLDFYIAYKGHHIDYEKLLLNIIDGNLAFYAPRTLQKQLMVYREMSNGVLIGFKFVDKEQSLRTIIVLPRDYFGGSADIVDGVDIESRLEGLVKNIVLAENMAKTFMSIGFILTLFIPVFCVSYYIASGREKKELLKYIDERIPPETGEKPWIVNLLYNGDVGIFTREVFAATVLDLISRGVIEVRKTFSTKGEDIVLTIKDYSGELDDYEAKVLEILRKFSVDGRNISLENAEEKLKNRRFLQDIMREAREVFNPKPYMDIVKKAVKSPKRLLVALFIATISLWIGSIVSLFTLNTLEDNYYAVKTFATTFFASIEWIPWMLLPAYVLGRWRDDYVIKFYSWTKFVEKVKKKGLYNIASLEELHGRMARILAYLIAMGESKYVMKAFEKTDHDLLKLYKKLLLFLTATYPSHFYPRRGGGTRGGGGGFGGGGAGVR